MRCERRFACDFMLQKFVAVWRGTINTAQGGGLMQSGEV